MAAGGLALLPALLVAALCAASWRAEAAIGVNWGTVSDHRAPPGVVVDLMRANRISKVKLFDADPGVLRALAGSGIQVMVGVTNGELASIAGSQAVADDWVAQNVSRYVGRGGVDIRHRPEDLPRIQRADGGGVGGQQLSPQQAWPQVTFGCCTSQQHWHAEMK